MRKINVWGGVNGDEWESQALVYKLHDMEHHEPLAPLVSARIAHTDGNGFLRGGEHNLAFGFPGTHDASAGYVQRRAAQIMEQSSDTYGTIDAHQIMRYGIRTAYIDQERGVSPIMLGFLRKIGIRHLVATEGWGMQGHIPNALLLESRYRPGTERSGIARAIRELSCDPNPPTAQARHFEWYKFAGALHADIYPPPRTVTATSFEPLHKLPDAFTAAVGLQGLATHVLNCRDMPLVSGVWGEFGIPIPTPDASAWPE